jgi:hypothetical protein
MKRILLGTIRLYWRLTPGAVRSALSTQGTSQGAYETISAGNGGLGTFIIAALPLRRLGLYGGESDW